MIWAIAATLGGLVLVAAVYLCCLIQQLPSLDEVDHD